MSTERMNDELSQQLAESMAATADRLREDPNYEAKIDELRRLITDFEASTGKKAPMLLFRLKELQIQGFCSFTDDEMEWWSAAVWEVIQAA